MTPSLRLSNRARIDDALAGVKATKIIVTNRAFAASRQRIMLIQSGVAEEGLSNPAPSGMYGRRVMRELNSAEIEVVNGGIRLSGEEFSYNVEIYGESRWDNFWQNAGYWWDNQFIQLR